jgi:hypothetical protein
MDRYESPAGYDHLIATDLEDFNRRVKHYLGFESPVQSGTGKPWDFRPALAVLYPEKVRGYDWWGHTDLDCVYGDVGKWVTEGFLDGLDVHSNHNTYVCGPWTLYRNTDRVNNLFREYQGWQEFMTDPRPNGWVENEFSRLLERSGLRYQYTFWQGNPWAERVNLRKENGKLYQDGKEIPMFHFRKSKTWPIPTQ